MPSWQNPECAQIQTLTIFFTGCICVAGVCVIHTWYLTWLKLLLIVTHISDNCDVFEPGVVLISNVGLNKIVFCYLFSNILGITQSV